MVEQYSVHVCIQYATLNLHCLVWSMLPYTAPTALALAGQPHSCQRHFWGNAADLATSACCTQTRAGLCWIARHVTLRPASLLQLWHHRPHEYAAGQSAPLGALSSTTQQSMATMATGPQELLQISIVVQKGAHHMHHAWAPAQRARS